MATKQKQRIKQKSRSKQFTSSQNQKITAVYTETFPKIKGNLKGADKQKKKLQMKMWEQQQETIICKKQNIHLTNDSMNAIYAEYHDWEYLMLGDGTSMSIKVWRNNSILAHQVRMYEQYKNKRKYRDQETKNWRKRVSAAARKAEKSFENIFAGRFYWIIQLFSEFANLLI